jgi:hypothetical protein
LFSSFAAYSAEPRPRAAATFLGMTSINWLKLVLTYCVPYAVCTYGAVSYRLNTAEPPRQPQP